MQLQENSIEIGLKILLINMPNFLILSSNTQEY